MVKVRRARKAPKAQKKKNSSRVRGPTMNAAMLAYDRMLTDPCGCVPVHPPYVGTGSGYLMRTTNHQTVTWSGTSLAVGDTTGSFLATWTPSAGQLLVGKVGGGTTQTNMATIQVYDWPLVSNTVKRWRPIAACIKWIPTGAYAKRSGEIGVGYTAGQLIGVGDVWSPQLGITQAMQRAPNGGSPHEARWLPTNSDQRFNLSGNTEAAGGSVFIVGQNIDGVNAAATGGGLSGYLECTTIWEWEPNMDAAGGGVTITNVPVPPAPFALTDYLPKIKNVGAFVVEGLGAVAQATGHPLGPMLNHATQYVSTMLTGGVRQIRNARPSITVT